METRICTMVSVEESKLTNYVEIELPTRGNIIKGFIGAVVGELGKQLTGDMDETMNEMFDNSQEVEKISQEETTQERVEE